MVEFNNSDCLDVLSSHFIYFDHVRIRHLNVVIQISVLEHISVLNHIHEYGNMAFFFSRCVIKYTLGVVAICV